MKPNSDGSRCQVTDRVVVPGSGVWVLTLRHDDFAGWSFVLSFLVDGQPFGFRMTPVDDPATARPPAMTRRLLASVPFGELETVGRAELDRITSPTSEVGISAGLRMAVTDAKQRLDATPRPGRRGRADVDYAALAAAYVERLGDGSEVAALAASLGYSPSRVRNMLYEARRRGLLTNSLPGRAGGELTDKAKELLDGER